MDENMLCTTTHEYILEKDGIYEVGITDFAIGRMGDVIFVELPDTETEFSKGEVFATIESVMAAKELYLPISGKVIEVNEEIINNPERLNDYDYDNKWLIKIESNGNLVDFADLLDYSDYIEELE